MPDDPGILSPVSTSIARRSLLVASFVLAFVGCKQPAAPAPATASTPIAPAPSTSAPGLGPASLSASAPGFAPASAPGFAPAPASGAPSSEGIVAEFMRVNQVDHVLDSWVDEMKRQWDEQAAVMKVKPPPSFWDESLAEYDMDAERAAILASVSSGISEAEMREDVEWVERSDLGDLSAKLDAVSRATMPLQAALADEAQRAISRVSGRPVPPAPPMPITQASLPPADLATIHAFMERLGYGAPEALAPRLLAALRHALSQAPAETWDDPALVAASVRAALGIEGEFARTWTPAEARRIAAELDSPGGRRHDALMDRLTPLVMARSQPFMESLQHHVLKRYAKIFNVAWEEHVKEKQQGAAP